MWWKIWAFLKWGPSIDFDEDDIEVWGLSKKSAWAIFGIMAVATGGAGFIGLLLWYRSYDKEKERRRDEPDE